MPFARRSLCAALAWLASLSAEPGHAQRVETATLVIWITDQTTGAPITNARVAAAEADRQVFSDRSGRAEIGRITPGNLFVTVEGLGYSRERFVLDLSAGGTLEVELALVPLPLELEGVAADVERQNAALRQVGFYERQREGFGTHITREQIDDRKPQRMSDLFRGVRGMRVEATGRLGDGAYRLVSTRGIVSVSNRACSPKLFIDGIGVPTTDLDMFPPAHIEAIEAYPSRAGVPPQYSPTDSPCGAVFLWTRSGRR